MGLCSRPSHQPQLKLNRLTIRRTLTLKTSRKMTTSRGLLPDPSWIAIVCGVSKEQWNADEGGGDSDLPEGFFVAPRDVYMPDLTAIGDVLLGKLGYGTVAECVDSSTPFVYVSRPLFIEEHGLRRLLDPRRCWCRAFSRVVRSG
ncbi:hypothetical protein B0H14DRAFT_1476468 [Mycena olivaceomarginata]|nr:hypothetical protein B0H14DRAFT_1476468 [Mycena olivaceomarginata]